MIRWLTSDVFDGLATLDDGSVDLVVTSPPFLALRSYLPADHPDKGKEIGGEATPAEFLDVLLKVSAELRRVLAPHGSIAVELGDTYAGSGGAGGDYDKDGWRDAQPRWSGSANRVGFANHPDGFTGRRGHGAPGGDDWPLAKSKTLIPELYRIALAYGINPLTGVESPAGRWRVRNVVTWCRPNPPVGALGDKWRPATSDVVVACLSQKRFWDDLATRKPTLHPEHNAKYAKPGGAYASSKREEGLPERGDKGAGLFPNHPSGAPLLDYWEIPPTGYAGAHYAVYPPALVEPLVKAMAPPKVCRVCGEPSRRITDAQRIADDGRVIAEDFMSSRDHGINQKAVAIQDWSHIERQTLGWTDCGHDDWRLALILDPFAGSGTTLAVASGHGHDAVGIDLDPRNEVLARDRIGPLMFDGLLGSEQ